MSPQKAVNIILVDRDWPGQITAIELTGVNLRHSSQKMILGTSLPESNPEKFPLL